MEKKNRYKKICLIILKAAIALFLIVVLNRIFMPKYIYENQDGRVTEEFYKEQLDTDIIFVGSSTVYSGISPVILWQDYGYTSYDRGNASQPMWTSYYMIEDAIACHKPKLVVLDIGFIKYWDTYAEEPSNRKAIDGMRFSPSKIACIEAAMDPEEKLTDYLFPIFRFHTRWKELSHEDFQYMFYHSLVTHNGFLLDFRETKQLPKHEGYMLKDNTLLSERNVEYLEKIIELCQDNEIQVMLMKVPSYSDNWSFDYDAQITDIAADYGVNYINFDPYSEEIGLDYKKHSPDKGNHLNTPGAEVFTKYLGAYISENYRVPVHTGEPAYEAVWDKKIERYETEKQKAIEKLMEEASENAVEK